MSTSKKQFGKERLYVTLQLVVYHPGKSGHELKARTFVETVEECSLLAYLMAYPACLLIAPGTTRSGVVLYSTIRLTHPVSQEKLSQSSLQANDGAFSCSSLFSSNCSLCQVNINQRAQALSEISN